MRKDIFTTKIKLLPAQSFAEKQQLISRLRLG